MSKMLGASAILTTSVYLIFNQLYYALLFILLLEHSASQFVFLFSITLLYNNSANLQSYKYLSFTDIGLLLVMILGHWQLK